MDADTPRTDELLAELLQKDEEPVKNFYKFVDFARTLELELKIADERAEHYRKGYFEQLPCHD